MIQGKQLQMDTQRVSFSLLWDGIYNVDELGEMIVPPMSPSNDGSVSYNCTKRFLASTSSSKNGENQEQFDKVMIREVTSTRVRDFSSESSPSVELKFVPYEQVLVIPVEIDEIDKVSYITFRIFQKNSHDVRSDFKIQAENLLIQREDSQRRLVYQETLQKDEIFCLSDMNSSLLDETDYDFSKRIANYWGVEDFANWYHQTYTIEVLVFAKSEAFNTNTIAFRYIEPGIIVARDHLNYNYNYERNCDLFRYLNDFSRIQRLLRNKRAFFIHLQHIEDYLKLNSDAELLEALEFFEEQAHFPTIQAIPIGVLPSSIFNQLTTNAYAIYDVGTRSCHGGFTHRLQWHAITHLMTEKHTTAITFGFNYSALELYCKARSSLWDGTNNPASEFNVDLWRFLFDRFNKYAMSGDPQSTLSVTYPEYYEDELHYAEQTHMALMNFDQNPRVIQEFIKSLIHQSIERVSSISPCQPLTIGSIKNLDIWLKRYLDQLQLSPDSRYTSMTDHRLRWGCLISSNEWEKIAKELESQSIHFHKLECIASKLRSFFCEAVIAVEIVAELCRNSQLIPHDNVHRSVFLVELSEEKTLANVLEEIAPYARILSLLRQVDGNGKHLLSLMSDDQGNNIRCLIRADESLLNQGTIDMLKARSRLNLNSSMTSGRVTSGIAFP